MNDIKATNRQSFFPSEKKSILSEKSLADPNIKTKFGIKKDFDGMAQVENDSKVEIPQKIKDFARIKKAVDGSPDISNEEKILDLKGRINSGEYHVNYEDLANKILAKEF